MSTVNGKFPRSSLGAEESMSSVAIATAAQNGYPAARRYTPVVKSAFCEHKGITPHQLEIGTLKRTQTELQNALENMPMGMHWRVILEDLLIQVRCAIGDE